MCGSRPSPRRSKHPSFLAGFSCFNPFSPCPRPAQARNWQSDSKLSSSASLQHGRSARTCRTPGPWLSLCFPNGQQSVLHASYTLAATAAAAAGGAPAHASGLQAGRGRGKERRASQAAMAARHLTCLSAVVQQQLTRWTGVVRIGASVQPRTPLGRRPEPSQAATARPVAGSQPQPCPAPPGAPCPHHTISPSSIFFWMSRGSSCSTVQPTAGQGGGMGPTSER